MDWGQNRKYTQNLEFWLCTKITGKYLFQFPLFPFLFWLWLIPIARCIASAARCSAATVTELLCCRTGAHASDTHDHHRHHQVHIVAGGSFNRSSRFTINSRRVGSADVFSQFITVQALVGCWSVWCGGSRSSSSYTQHPYNNTR